MRRILTIAAREYRSMVGTKAFLFTIAMMPLLMLGSMLVPALLQKFQSHEPKQLIVIDRTGRLLDALQELARQRNEELSQPRNGAEAAFGDRSPYEITAFDGGEWNDESRFELSEKVRGGDVYAFLEIPRAAMGSGFEPSSNIDHEGATTPDAGASDAVTPSADDTAVTFYSEDAALSQMRGWLSRSLNQSIQSQRLQQANVDPVVVANALTRVEIDAKGLLTKSEAGAIIAAEEKDELASIFMPIGIMMLMFIVIFLAAQPMLEAVMEEKSERIAEVLLGSVNAQDLMTGKLLGNVAGSLTVFVIYAGGIFGVAASKGWVDKVPFEILPWFVIYQILGVLFFSSIFMAIGASVKQIKEAQSLLLPVWMVLFSPMFVWFNIVQDPNSSLAIGMSFFPPSTPLMMTLRLSTGAEIPPWQIIASIAVMLVATWLVVRAAAKIFQIGILWQGKTPRIGEVVRWLFRNPMVGS